MNYIEEIIIGYANLGGIFKDSNKTYHVIKDKEVYKVYEQIEFYKNRTFKAGVIAIFSNRDNAELFSKLAIK